MDEVWEHIKDFRTKLPNCRYTRWQRCLAENEAWLRKAYTHTAALGLQLRSSSEKPQRISSLLNPSIFFIIRKRDSGLPY